MNRGHVAKVVCSQNLKYLIQFEKIGITILGWFKTPVSSQTHKLISATKFSDYLGLKDYKKAKKIKHFIHLRLANWPQSFNTYLTISPTMSSDH